MRLGAQQAERHRGFAVVLLLAAVSDLLQAGGVVPTAERDGGKWGRGDWTTYETYTQCRDIKCQVQR